MEIKFGSTKDNEFRLNFFGCLSFTLAFGVFVFQYNLDRSFKSIVRSSTINMTSTMTRSSCGIPYEECLCSVQLMKNEYYKDCLTDYFLMSSRIFILFSFVIQICFVRDCFALSGKYSRFVVHVLSIISVFLFFIIAYVIYQDSCFHRFITMVSYGVDTLLVMGTFYEWTSDRYFHRCSCNNHIQFRSQ
ncbi:hypothetical protein I4U23_011842 [Adineta vaga]|nr:hypothetical protein I4U23_011842 [Adineta vaga]